MTLARPWFARTASAFTRLAGFFQEILDGSDRDRLECCCSDRAAPSRQDILSSPSAAIAVADAHACVAEFASASNSECRRRAKWREVIDISTASDRIGQLADLIFVHSNKVGTLNILHTPCSLPGFDICVSGPTGEIRIFLDHSLWLADRPYEIVPVDSFRLYNVDVRVDADAPWIARPELADGGRCRSTATWSWGSVPSDAASLIEQSLGATGSELAAFVYTLVPIEPVSVGCFASSTNRAVPGALYVTVTTRPEMLAEMIVHEAGHAWLNCWQEQGAVVRDNETLVQSPFTGSPRPLLGILHGVVAFGWIARFWEGLLNTGAGPFQQVAERRLNEVQRQVSEGLTCLESLDALTELGWEVARRPGIAKPVVQGNKK